MKTVNMILFAILLTIIAGCQGGKKQSADNLVTVDVNKSYPEKELKLQDFMDVEYVPLESTDDFITRGIVKAIGKNVILTTNGGSDGDIFFFDRSTGKGIRKINRKGQSGEEYTQVTEVVLDEDNNEMFINDYPARKIMVYDLYGNFKRGFSFIDTSYYLFIFNYDQNNLIGYRSYLPLVENEQSEHILISKKTGKITKEIKISTEKIVTPVITEGEASITPSFNFIIPYQGNWVFARASSDTIYNYINGDMSPIIVRTPSIHSMDSQIFLFPGTITDCYYFMYTQKKEFNLEAMKGFPTTDLVYDKQENAIFKCIVNNDDYSNKQQVSLSLKPISQEIAYCQSLEAPNLIEDNEEGHLKGKLKEVVAQLNEDSNPVIMLAKYKK